MRLLSTVGTAGFMFGFMQRSLIADIAFDTPSDLDALAARLDIALAPHVFFVSDVDRPTVRDLGSGPEARLVSSVWQGIAGLLEAADIPVAGEARLVRREVDGPAGQTVMVRLAMPAFAAPLVSAALKFVTDTVAHLAASTSSDEFDRALREQLEQLVAQLRGFALKGNNSRHLVRAANLLEIPMMPMPNNVVQLGWGRRARLFRSTSPDSYPVLTAGFVLNKLVTTQMLRAAAVPVPDNFPAPRFDAALDAARRLGFPVAVKPTDRERGAGATADVRNAAELRAAWDKARAVSPNVMVEKHVNGSEFRLLVVRGKLFWAFERAPARVTGDGSATVSELVDRENSNRRSGRGTGHARTEILVDDDALRILGKQGLALSSVPSAGQVVRLQGSPRLTGGGDLIPVFDQVHPDNALAAERAARLMRLEIAGIDMLIPDISRSWREVGGRITEVNAGPQFSPFTRPDIYEALLRQCIDGDGRVPSVLLVGDEAGEVARDLDARLAAAGFAPGTATCSEVTIDGALAADSAVGPQGAAHILTTDPLVGAIVMAASPGELLAHGLPLDRFDAIALSPGLPASDEIRDVVRSFAEHVRGAFVVAAGSPASGLVRDLPGNVVVDEIPRDRPMAHALFERIAAHEAARQVR